MDFDVVSAGVAAVAALVSVYGAVLSRRSAAEVKAAGEDRKRRRGLLGDVLDSGYRLLEDVRAVKREGFPSSTAATIDERLQGWMQDADAAVREADSAQLARFHAFVEAPELDAVLAVHLGRLQEIQDRL